MHSFGDQTADCLDWPEEIYSFAFLIEPEEIYSSESLADSFLVLLWIQERQEIHFSPSVDPCEGPSTYSLQKVNSLFEDLGKSLFCLVENHPEMNRRCEDP